MLLEKGAHSGSIMEAEKRVEPDRRVESERASWGQGRGDAIESLGCHAVRANNPARDMLFTYIINL
jgi:hypothetical protein